MKDKRWWNILLKISPESQGSAAHRQPTPAPQSLVFFGNPDNAAPIVPIENPRNIHLSTGTTNTWPSVLKITARKYTIEIQANK